MKNINTKNYLFGLVVISALSWIGLSWVNDVDLSSFLDFLKLIPTVVTIDSVIVFIFTRWLWKWNIFHNWLVPFPDLNGTWIGEIKSDWINETTGKTIDPVPVMLTIKQSFHRMSCVMQTIEMKSYSYIEGFTIDFERQIKQFSYSYTSKPKVLIEERSKVHDGTVIFDIIEKPNKKLVGRYWTERKTRGEINLCHISNKIEEDISEYVKDHPMK